MMTLDLYALILPQKIGYVKYFKNHNDNSNKKISVKASHNKLLKKYIQIWKKITNLLDIKFDSEPVFRDNDKYIKTK